MSVKTESSISKTQWCCSTATRSEPCFDTEGTVLGDYTDSSDGNLISGTLLSDFKVPLCHFLDYGTEDVLSNVSQLSYL